MVVDLDLIPVWSNAVGEMTCHRLGAAGVWDKESRP